ncbi:thiamine phosphate synthase [Alteriqipengyuania lutimaris]|uniref:Thiamine phosphate synthase n=1 Tax=Alteriqipengyuania lutimaris TaxID=1538146 RepID=A0A395LJS8_9SPHN|nr:thiamine phosphate synthase [Alteriqipengyuania lutimaris]MBB3034140.1 thiamine-phosphate pyrophosphorylase [Alteriqipengyuania lutimaris]RDS76929.1 thiamine phosphate synthase [Alteriqipengyuania lutimaris]
MPIQPLPDLWLLSDARNDAALEDALVRLPEGSGFVFRHYHLDEARRRERFEMLRSICRSKNHLAVLSGAAELVRDWEAEGVYGPADAIGNAAPMLHSKIRIATAHHATEIAAAEAAGADAIMLSPVYPTRSHPGGAVLGPEGFRALAGRTRLPVIALGGMTAERASDLGVTRWAAIDGLS